MDNTEREKDSEGQRSAGGKIQLCSLSIDTHTHTQPNLDHQLRMSDWHKYSNRLASSGRQSDGNRIIHTHTHAHAHMHTHTCTRTRSLFHSRTGLTQIVRDKKKQWVALGPGNHP